MGVPTFFRRLSKRYPIIISNCIELPGDQDPSAPNPNTEGDREFDNLYLDMNGIIHPCFHPEGVAPPLSEEEILHNISLYIERIFNIVRPRKLLFLAIDGVAPRAKMNQQRARRYRAAKDSAYNRMERLAEATVAQDEEKIAQLTQPDYLKMHDSNVITPGTEFFKKVTNHLRRFVKSQQEHQSGWRDIQVIISDASVPGEGEHKVMDFIRGMRFQPGYDPNTKHCMYGLDADLIFLGLTTHEANFTIIRENIIDVTTKNEYKTIGPEWFHFVSLWVLRQCLDADLRPRNLPFAWNLENAIDDFVFICYACGNDFIPGVPGFSIHEGAIDKAIRCYRDLLPRYGGYLTFNGSLPNINAFVDFMLNIPASESYSLASIVHPAAKSIKCQEFVNSLCENPDAKLEDLQKFVDKITEAKEDDDKEVKNPNPRYRNDELKILYYKKKFNIDISRDRTRIVPIVEQYFKGMMWTLKYYQKGVPSWEWFYPYHNPPCLSDFDLIPSNIVIQFDMGKPFNPLEQLMAVLPPQSAHALPPVMGSLMTNPNSPLKKYYPDNFSVDLNGAFVTWKGTPLIPFIDAKELLDCLRSQDLALTLDEMERNNFGHHHIFIPSKIIGSEKIQTPFPLQGPPVWGYLYQVEERNRIPGAASCEFKYWYEFLNVIFNGSIMLQGVIPFPDVLEFSKSKVYLGDKFQNDAFDENDVHERKQLPLQIPGIMPGTTPDSRKERVARFASGYVVRPI